MTIARFAHLVLALSVMACAGSTPDAETPEAGGRTAAAQAPAKKDPCAALPVCPVACPEPIASIGGRSCGSQGLQCGDETAVCSCDGTQWLCDRPERPSGTSACEKPCREET